MRDLASLTAALGATRDVDEELALVKEMRALPEAALDGLVPCKLAVLTGYASGVLTNLAFGHALARGVRLTTHETHFGLYEQALLAEDPELVAFAPDVVYLCVGAEHLVLDSVDAELARWRRLWEKARALFACDVVLNTFVEPSTRVYGSSEWKIAESFGRKLLELNLALAREAPSYVHLLDVNALAADVGRLTFFDPKWYAVAKLPASLGSLPAYAERLAAVLGALKGKSKKALVLDLDGTLWGGVVGDEGAAGVRIGADTAEGESHRAFQKYVKALGQRGVLLAVCSKNDEAVARAVFARPEMILGLDDFAAFVANWEPKDQNLRHIAAALNVLPDSLVFVDDSPAERELVRQRLPEVTVVDLPPDPARYAGAVAAGAYFETVYVSDEDRLRARAQVADRQRASLEQTSTSYDEYLASLDMEARIGPFRREEVPRVVQLLAKTNQFNLTGRRYTEPQMLERMSDESSLCLCASLRDRFGDHGLVSVFVASCRGDTCEIENWVMSCRVFKRGLEATLFEEARRRLLEKRVRRVEGRLIPTAKNGYVADLFPSLGFRSLAGEPGAEQRFVLELSSQPMQTGPIRVQRIEG